MSHAYLAVDTATEACSVALSLDGNVAERFEVVRREHTSRLLPMIQELMAAGGIGFGQLAGIACGIGPGSFAGLRIGVGVVKGIGLAHDLPVVGVSSLAMLAQRAMRLDNVEAVAAIIDARMNEVYFGAFRRGAARLAVPAGTQQVGDPSRLPALPDGSWVCVGTGWGTYAEVLRRSLGVSPERSDGAALPHAEEALLLAAPEFAAGRVISADALAPAYLRDNVALTLAEQAARRT